MLGSQKIRQEFAFGGRATIHVPGPMLQTTAQAGFPASHTAPLNSRGVSCTPTAGVKGKNGAKMMSLFAKCSLTYS